MDDLEAWEPLGVKGLGSVFFIYNKYSLNADIVKHLRWQEGLLNTNTPRRLSKLLTMNQKFKAICINMVLQMVRISLYVTSMVKNSERDYDLLDEHDTIDDLD